MTEPIVISRYDGGNPPGFSGRWRDLPLSVTLDTSAVLKLAGNADVSERHDVLATKSHAIVIALRRLAEMGQIETASGRAETMLSALDLD